MWVSLAYWDVSGFPRDQVTEMTEKRGQGELYQCASVVPFSVRECAIFFSTGTRRLRGS